MGQIIPTAIIDFSRGMTNDPRNPDSSYAQLIEHFDTFTAKHKLTPFKSYENGDSSAATNQIGAFAWLGGILYGNGIHSGGTGAEVFSVNNFTSPTWSAVFPSVTGSARTTADLPFFTGYKGALYGVRGGRYVYSFTISGASLNASAADLSTYTTVSNGLVHSKDDTLYVGYDNKIAKNNAGSWTVAALTLPTNCYITSICEYGNYLAIATASNDVDVQSTVYLWDRDSSLTTVSEKLDWGAGTLKVLEYVDGYLVGVSQENSGNYFNSRFVVRTYAGGLPQKLVELRASSANAALGSFKQKVNNRVLFTGTITLNGTAHTGIWSVGRADAQSPFGITLERLSANTTATVTNPLGFIVVGDYLFHAYIDNGAAYNMVKTDDATAYTATSAYESQIFNSVLGLRSRHIPDSSQMKKLIGVTLTFEPLPAAATVVLKYKIDSDSSWTQIFSYASTNALHHSATNIESTSANLPEGKEIQFRIESTGGAVITGLSFEQEITGKRLY